MFRVEEAKKIANFLDDKAIKIRKNRHLYTYKVKDISRIYRTRDKYINIYSRNPVTLAEEVEEFYCEFSLPSFLKFHGIEKYMKQAQQSWLVNVSEVKIVNSTDMELVLWDGNIVPTSSKYIKNFYEKKVK